MLNIVLNMVVYEVYVNELSAVCIAISFSFITRIILHFQAEPTIVSFLVTHTYTIKKTFN